ncbi:hypothetical protein GOBAR_AA09312 [Gossypium barbadense]|uniref:Uncharacterized protein n=1 Tax=Gossypium barbadense TaxID=3634 RepID=A0A2P5Y6Z4_GOSBA|nr:hypothetical protein GOBAR_AA09312 [Gossypium barbadense]
MEVESGESSSRKRKWERPPVAVKERAEKRGNRISLGVIVKYFDNIDAPYEWLLPGWIVEERFVLFDYKGCVRIYEDEGNNGGLIYLIEPFANLIIGRNKALFDNPTRDQPVIGSIGAVKVASVNGDYSLACCYCWWSLPLPFLGLDSPLFTSITALKPTMLIVLYEPSDFSSSIYSPSVGC